MLAPGAQATPADFVRKWNQRFADNSFQFIREGTFREFAADVATVFGTDVASVPEYQPGLPYQKGNLVRYTPAGGQEAFYYALKAGTLLPPGFVTPRQWKVVPGPTSATALSQELTLLQAQGIEGDQVVAGRTYLVDFGPDAVSGKAQIIALRGISGHLFDVEGTLEVAGVRTPVTNVDVLAGTWQVKTAGAGSPTGAVFMRLRNGETLFYLGQRLRNKSKLGLRHFSAGTLPPILPAPVLDPDRPAGVAAPGTPFPLHGSIGGAASGPAAIAEYTRTVSDGDHFLLTGSDLDQAVYPVYQAGNFYATTVTTGDAQKAAVRLPRVGAAWGAALAWPSTRAGIGLPVLLNTARVKWEQNVWAPALEINIFGENLAHGNVEGGAGYVAIKPAGGPVTIYPVAAANPYRAPFTVPAGLAPGKLDYWYHNGHGGDFGWSAKRTVTVVADHVLLHNFGPATVLTLSATDPVANDATLAASYVQNKHVAIAPGLWPIGGTVVVPSYSKLSCTDPTKTAQLVVTSSWLGTEDRGMLGTNYAEMAMVENVELLNPYDAKLGNSEALVVFNNVSQLWLKGVRARWTAAYSERQAGPVKEALPVQPLRIASSNNVFLDALTLTGSGTYFGHSSQFFLLDYSHYLTNNADHGLYGLHMREWCIIGGLFRDFDPASTDGVDRGIRAIKEGGQGGTNQRRHLEGILGELLGIVYGGKNPAPDVNQFEMLLSEDNRAKFRDQVVSATRNTVTVTKSLAGAATADEQLVVIVAGRGMGQVRGILSSTNSTITVDEAWRVVPDSTSVLQTGNFSRDHTFYKLHFTGKPANATNPGYNHSSFLNLFGGCFGFLVDQCFGSYFRQGISVVATQHDPDMVDQSAFNVVRNCQFPHCRWGERIEAVPGQSTWAMSVIGILATLFSRNTYEATTLSDLVYQLPRKTAGPVANIDLFICESQAPATGLNDYSPSFVDDPMNPPIAPIDGTLAGFAQPAEQAQVVLGTPGTVLVAAGELGPLELLPAGAVIDASGVLRYAGTDPAILVWVDGGEETPLARTQEVGTASPSTGYTDAQIDAFLAGKAPNSLPLLAPFVGYVNGALVGYTTFEAACDARPAVLHVRTPEVTLTATNRTFSGVLYANDAEFTVPDGLELRVSRNSQLYNANVNTPGTGLLAVVGGGIPTGAAGLPQPTECLQLIDCRLGNLRCAINSWQGLVLRGNTTVALANTDAPLFGSVPAYLYDYSVLATLYPSFAYLDYRPKPGFAVLSSSTLGFTRDADYGVIASGTFTVDTTRAQPGVVVRVELAVGASTPTLPAGFELINGTFQAGKRNGYGFSVTPTGIVEYFIYQKP